MNARPRTARNALIGVALLARGRAAGLGQFVATREGFMASLAPLVAFPLVGAGLVLASGEPVEAAADLLATLCALLAPPVLSEVLAARWNRHAHWLRYAVAFNWCQWAIPVVAVLLMLVMAMAIAVGVPGAVAGGGMVALLVAYGLWLHWFLARHALDLSGARAALLVAGVNVGTGLLVLAPHFLAVMAGAGPARD